MDEPIDDDREFTDEQLRAALKDIGREVRKSLFAIGHPVIFMRDGLLIALYADGTEKMVDRSNLRGPGVAASK